MADQWLTYEEAGALFGLSAEAMRKRARRLGWRIQTGNDNQTRTRILVPEGAEIRPAGHPPGWPAGDRRDDRPAIRAEDPQALSLLSDALRQERERREAAEEAKTRAEEAAARAQGEAAGLKEAVRLAEDSARRADAAAAEARQREAAAVARFEQAEGRAERAAVLEAERDAARDAATREAAQVAKERIAREAAEAGRDIARAAAEASERRWEAAEAALAEVSSGGRLRRVWIALRRGR
jgi:hypothetical protein